MYELYTVYMYGCVRCTCTVVYGVHVRVVYGGHV